MLGLGLDRGDKKVKAARVVGETMGLYHPHGDSSIYGAMQRMAGMVDEKKAGQYIVTNSNYPLIDGLGNWGDHSDEAAAPRYTECRLSPLASTLLLDREYMSIIPQRPNYDDTRLEPVLLPAKLPFLMLNGASGVGVGAKTEFPGFEADGVIECALAALHGELNAKMCFQKLVAKFPYGGGGVDDESWKELLKSGNAGTVYVYPNSEYDGKVLVVTSVIPGVKLSVDGIRNKLLRNSNTKQVRDETNKAGIRIVAVPGSMTQGERDAWAEELQYALYGSMPARVNVLDFAADGGKVAGFVQSNIPDIFCT